jgi:hypothetical protein
LRWYGRFRERRARKQCGLRLRGVLCLGFFLVACGTPSSVKTPTPTPTPRPSPSSPDASLILSCDVLQTYPSVGDNVQTQLEPYAGKVPSGFPSPSASAFTSCLDNSPGNPAYVYAYPGSARKSFLALLARDGWSTYGPGGYRSGPRDIFVFLSKGYLVLFFFPEG